MAPTLHRMTESVESLKLSIIIPVFNEVDFIEEIVDRVRAVELGDAVSTEIIIVDDGSTDGTTDKLKKIEELENVRVYLHERNQGKGAALHTAFEHATGDFILIQDADLEYDPREIPVLLEPILRGAADVVYGSRFQTASARRVLYYWHSVLNRMLTNLCNMITNINLTDMEVCYKVIRLDLLRQIKLKEKRFGFEPEVTIKLARLKPKPRFYEVGISYSGRTYAEGKKIGMRDGIRALWCLARYAWFN